MLKFETGKTYGGRSSANYFVFYYFNVISRTENEITVEWMRKFDDRGNEIKTFAIHANDDCEYVYPFSDNTECVIKASWGKA